MTERNRDGLRLTFEKGCGKELGGSRPQHDVEFPESDGGVGGVTLESRQG